MPDERFREHLEHPQGLAASPDGAFDGHAGGAACGDLVRFSVRVAGDQVAAATFEASGCGATTAAGSAAVSLVAGETVLDAARVGSAAIAAELGGLSAGKLHAADLVSDALAWALGAAVAADCAADPVPNRVLVAMSGGVDSAVAALRCQSTTAASQVSPTPRPEFDARPPAGTSAHVAPTHRAHFDTRLPATDVCAVTVELWRDPENDGDRSCCSAQAVRVARALAHQMGLPHFTLDLREPFREGVVQPWLDEHAAGLTPNPCVRCNGHVRLDAMLDFADRIGAPTLATGHYARQSSDGLLRLAADPAKDQAYMLAALAPTTLARLRFPLGELTKPQVRALAAEAELSVAHSPESQDLCFLAGTGRAAFLARHGGLRDRPGAIVDRGGRELGRHRGAHHFTVGQRRGLAIGGTEDPLYVLRTDAGTNSVTVGPLAALDVDTVAVRGVRLHRDETAVDGVKLRYRSAPVACTLRGGAISLAEPVAGAAPGQTACFLAGDVVVGSGTIV